MYFADAYSSWQRGSNENGNGLLREFSPKKTNFDHVTEEEMKHALQLINHRSRKWLGWKTPYEAVSGRTVALNLTNYHVQKRDSIISCLV